MSAVCFCWLLRRAVCGVAGVQKQGRERGNRAGGTAVPLETSGGRVLGTGDHCGGCVGPHAPPARPRPLTAVPPFACRRVLHRLAVLPVESLRHHPGQLPAPLHPQVSATAVLAPQLLEAHLVGGALAAGGAGLCSPDMNDGQSASSVSRNRRPRTWPELRTRAVPCGRGEAPPGALHGPDRRAAPEGPAQARWTPLWRPME